MEFAEFKKSCIDIFSANPTISQPGDEQISKLYQLTQIMLEVNKTMNLTAIKEENAIILRHYVDSLAVSDYIPQGAKIIDVGCGAGFPTLPLAIFRPDLSITALDSTAKRINYVSETANKLGLTNVTAIAERAEALGNDSSYRESFDIATARAVAALPILTELCLPFVKLGGKFIAMKAAKADDELALASNAIKRCGGSVDKDDKIILHSPFAQDEQRAIVSITKVSKTPKDLPRHFSKISKHPL